MSALDSVVLVLNRSWAAVHVSSVRRAVSLLYQGAALVVNPDDFVTHDFDSWKEASHDCTDGCLRAVSFKLRIPDVIRLKYFNGRQRRKIRFTRRSVFERDDHTCQYCGRRKVSAELTLDHVVPRCRGGRSTWDNLVVACIECNDQKGNRLPHEADMALLRRPRKPDWTAYLVARSGGRRASWQRFLDKAHWDSVLKG